MRHNVSISSDFFCLGCWTAPTSAVSLCKGDSIFIIFDNFTFHTCEKEATILDLFELVCLQHGIQLVWFFRLIQGRIQGFALLAAAHVEPL